MKIARAGIPGQKHSTERSIFAFVFYLLLVSFSEKRKKEGDKKGKKANMTAQGNQDRLHKSTGQRIFMFYFSFFVFSFPEKREKKK